MHFASEPSPDRCKAEFVLAVSELHPWSFIRGSNAVLRVCAKTNAEQEAYFQQNGPHPDPLPSDGRGNSRKRHSQLPKRLVTATDGGRFSLSHPMHPMGEGRGEGAARPQSTEYPAGFEDF